MSGWKAIARMCLWAGVASLAALSVPAHAEPEPVAEVVLRSEPVEISHGVLKQWGEEIHEFGWRHYECAPMEEFPGTILCLFAHSVMMNDIFRGTAVAVEAPRGMISKSALLGVDLRIEDLLAYRARHYPDGNPMIPEEDSDNAAGRERAFMFDVLPQLSERYQAQAVVAAAWGNLSTIAHELHHARYFSDTGYRTAIAEFWNEQLSEAERDKARAQLGTLYDSQNEDLIINEFQAYVLPGKPNSWAVSLNDTYRTALRDFLHGKGFSPLPAVEVEP
ncbi:MAG: hypothetical protein AB7G62_00715 [Magnetospirillum sp.]